MPKITLVQPQKKNPHRFNIFLDDKFAFGADEDLVVNRRLVLGKIIESGDLEKMLFEAEVGKLMERMYRLFSVRNRSEKEVRDYLKQLSFKRKLKDKEEISQLAIDFLIERLKQKGMLNDIEFAQNWVSSRSKKKGKIAIKIELMKKGVSREVINESLGQVRDEDEIKLAEQTLERKLKNWINLPQMEFRKKAYDFLLRRGFSYEIVKNVVENSLKKE